MAQLILVLIMGLALLTWASSGVVQTAREWFERDISSRARLVLVGAEVRRRSPQAADDRAATVRRVHLEIRISLDLLAAKSAGGLIQGSSA